MPDVSFVAASLNADYPVTTLSVSAPAGTTAGDVVIVIGTRNAFSAVDTLVDDNGSTPFTQVRSDFESGQGSSLTILRRVIQAGDPTTYTFDYDPAGDLGASYLGLVAMTFRNVDAAIFDVAPSAGTLTQESPDGNDITCVAVTSTLANCIHVICAGREGGQGYRNTPSGYTAVAVASDFDWVTSVHYKILTSAGSSGVQTYTAPEGGSGQTQSFIIKNNAGGGGGGSHSYPFAGKFAGLLGGKLA